MTIEDFRSLTKAPAPPTGLSPLLLALWHDARGDWAAAHGLVDDLPGADAAWVHAYLHRKEPDEANAGYWYRQAGRPHARMALDAEWDQIAGFLLSR